jgi:hypothetical protein
MNISKGIATWAGIVAAIGAAAVPVINQFVALIENTSSQWSTAEKTGLIAGAAIAAVTMLGRFAQAVAQIIKGS